MGDIQKHTYTVSAGKKKSWCMEAVPKDDMGNRIHLLSGIIFYVPTLVPMYLAVAVQLEPCIETLVLHVRVKKVDHIICD
jgi:hypothetical protein